MSLYRDTSLFPDENPDIEAEVARVLGEDVAKEWLEAKNTRFAGRAPKELIGTRHEFHIRNVLRSILHAGVS